MKKPDSQAIHPRDQIVELMARIYRAGMTTTSGGNISLRDDQGNTWITPSGYDKGAMRPDDIVCLRPGGGVEGKRPPSMERFFHQAIYAARPDLKAIIHAHPPALVSFSIVRQKPDVNISPVFGPICGKVDYSPFALPGSRELGDDLSTRFGNDCDAVILENHAVVVAGASPGDAFLRFETLEMASRALIHAHAIGRPAPLDDARAGAFDGRPDDAFTEMEEIQVGPEEQDLRRELAAMLRRACDQELAYSSLGEMSLRLGGDGMLITPRDLPRREVGPDDIVRLRDGEREPGKVPDRSAAVHRAIYRANPQVHSVIVAQPPHLMAFALAGVKPDMKTIPESWMFLRDIPLVPFETPLTSDGSFAGLFGPEQPAVLVGHYGIFVTGDGLLQTFDRLEVAESSARGLVMARPLGPHVPMDDAQIAALRKKFG